MAVKVLDGVFLGDGEASFDPDFLEMNKNIECSIYVKETTKTTITFNSCTLNNISNFKFFYYNFFIFFLKRRNYFST